MKFTNGHWLLKDNVKCYGAAAVTDVAIMQNRVIVYVSPAKISHRGQTLTGPLLTIEFTSPHIDVLGIKAYHFRGTMKRGPEFELHAEDLHLTVVQDKKKLTITSGSLTAQVEKDPFRICYFYGENLLTLSDTKQLAYLTVDQKPYIRERLNLSVSECLYGLGERFSNFVKNGQSVDIWNADGGTSSEQAYKNIPFYVSNRKYGVFIRHTGKISLEIGSESVSKTQFSVGGEELNYFMIAGDSLKQVLINYTDMTGKPALPPAWSFGLWLSTSFTTDYNEETVTHFLDGMEKRGIPISVFHFDCFWMKEYEWCNFRWDPEKFPHAESMLARLKERGLKICVWINPYIGQKSPLFQEGKENGYLLKKVDGSVWQWDMWQPGMAIVDFTNPDAVSWYKGYLRKLLQQGVDCFKTDFGERIPLDVCYSDHSDPAKMHNYYSYLYNKAVFELLQECRGPQEAVLFARSATAGSQKYPVHWSGDCEATYESMAECLRGGLSLALGGFGYWSHDIGGFENTATADLYKRWVAFGLLSTHSRLHGSSSYRVPWLFDEESVDVLRYFVNLKMKLMPYIYSAACETSQTGIPVMRPMVMEYTDDAACAYLERQYMLGESIVVAPIFNQNGSSEIYLPEGTFTHLLTNETIRGGRYIRRTYDYFSLPLWVRPNSILAMLEESEADKGTTYDSSTPMLFHIYEPEESAIANLYDSRGDIMCAIHANSDGNRVTVRFEGKCPGGTVRVSRKGQTGTAPIDKEAAEAVVLLS